MTSRINNKLKNKGFTNGKGFTIVELVIVIAVIGILAAVLIPTFNSIIDKANESKATQEVTNAMKELITLDPELDLDNVLIIYLDKDLLNLNEEVDPEYSFITSDKILNEKILYIFDYVDRKPKMLGHENVTLLEDRLIISGSIYERLDTSKLNNFPEHIRIFQKNTNQNDPTITLTIDPRSTNIDQSEILRVEGIYNYGDTVQINLILEEGYLVIYENEQKTAHLETNTYTITITKDIVIRIEHIDSALLYSLLLYGNSSECLENESILNQAYAIGDEMTLRLNTRSFNSNDTISIYINDVLISTYQKHYDENGNINNVIKYTITDEVIINDSLYLKLRFEKETDTSYIGFDNLMYGISEVNAEDVQEIRMIDYDHLSSGDLDISNGINTLQICKYITNESNYEYIKNFMKYLKNTKLNLYEVDDYNNTNNDEEEFPVNSTVELIPIGQKTRYVIVTEEEVYEVDIREIIYYLSSQLTSSQVNILTYKLDELPEAFPEDAKDGFMFDDYATDSNDYQAKIYTDIYIIGNYGSLDEFDVRKLLLSQQEYTHTNNFDEINQLYFEYNEMTFDILHNNQICVNFDDYYSIKFDVINNFTFDEYKINQDAEAVNVNLIDGTYYEIGGYEPYAGTNITYMKSTELTRNKLLDYINISIPNDKKLVFLKLRNAPVDSSDRFEEILQDSSSITLDEDITIMYQLVDIDDGDDINPLGAYETVYLVSPNGLSLAPEGKTALTLYNRQLVISSIGKVFQFIYHWQDLKETFEIMVNPSASSSVVTSYVKAEDYFDESLFDDYFVLLVLRNDSMLYTDYSNFNYTPNTDVIEESNQIILSSYISSMGWSHDFVIIPKEDLYQEITDEEIINIQNALGEDVLLEHIYFKHDDYYVYSSSPFLYPDVELAILEHSILGYTFYAYENTDIKVYKAGETPEILELEDVKDEEWFKMNIKYIHCSYYSKNPYLRDNLNTGTYLYS